MRSILVPRRVHFILLLVALAVHAYSQPVQIQQDSVKFVEMDPIVVTAARLAETVGSATMPTTVVLRNAMHEQGAIRLSDALIGVPGLAIIDDHGAGLQVQGFASDYTLILLDGEPVIGRTAGTLDVRRLSVEALDRIEIVQGPSSSLYGSDALAGVVNLISRQPDEGYEGDVSVRVGSFGTTSTTSSMAAGFDRFGARLHINRFASSGYDLTPASYGGTAPAFVDWTVDVRARAALTDRLKLRFGARGTTENQQDVYAASQEGETGTRFDNEGHRSDWSVHSELDFRVASRLALTTTLYTAKYTTETTHRRQADGAIVYGDAFDQYYRKAELQLDAVWSTQHLTTGGGGMIGESVGGSRYTHDPSISSPSSGQVYAFLQHLWDSPRLLKLVASARYDAHSDYAARFTPRLSMLLRPTEKLQFRASVGSGFKAPAFRQLYLAFTNPAAGYTVFGTTQVPRGLERLQQQGQIEHLSFDPETLEAIRAERSLAVNVGTSADLFYWFRFRVNAFYNDVHDLIETQPIAQKTNGQFVFGYFNLSRIYTRGAEAIVTLEPMPQARSRLEIRLGYQYLQARDRALMAALRSGTVFGRDSNGYEYRIGVRQYGGLFGRSPHSASLGASMRIAPLDLTANFRGRWRSRYGYRDIDGNALANRDDEFVGEYAVFDLTIAKQIEAPYSSSTEIQLGADNLFDITRRSQVPSLPGRRVFAALHLSF